MSFNIRLPIDPPPHDWSSRSPLVSHIITQHQADIIGFQEMFAMQRDQLLAQTKHYQSIGSGREADLSGEACNIFFRTDRWQLDKNAHGTFWYSDTPEQAGSKHWGNDYLRIVTWARLIHRNTGQGLYIYNSHWDFKNGFQKKAAKLLKQKIAQRQHKNDAYIIMGDFNALENSSAIQALMSSAKEQELIDVWQGFTTKQPPVLATKQGASFHGFSGQADSRIDYIFASAKHLKKISTAKLIKYHRQAIWPSDHFPLLVELIF